MEGICCNVCCIRADDRLIGVHQFIKKGMRGGVSYIARMYNKADNKYMKSYDKKVFNIYYIRRLK